MSHIEKKPGRHGQSFKAHPFTGVMPPTPQPIPIKQINKFSLSSGEKKALLWHLSQGSKLAKKEVFRASEFIHPKSFFSDLEAACEKAIEEVENQ